MIPAYQVFSQPCFAAVERVIRHKSKQSKLLTTGRWVFRIVWRSCCESRPAVPRCSSVLLCAGSGVLRCGRCAPRLPTVLRTLLRACRRGGGLLHCHLAAFLRGEQAASQQTRRAERGA